MNDIFLDTCDAVIKDSSNGKAMTWLSFVVPFKPTGNSWNFRFWGGCFSFSRSELVVDLDSPFDADVVGATVEATGGECLRARATCCKGVAWGYIPPYPI